MVRLGARRLRAGGRGLGHEDPGAVHVGGGAEARAGSHGLEGTDDETLGRGFRGGESWRPRPRGHEGQGAGAGYSGWGLGVWSTGGEVAKSAWHGGDQGLRAAGWGLARSRVRAAR